MYASIPMNTPVSATNHPHYVHLGKFASLGEEDPAPSDREGQIMRIRWIAAETCEKDVTDEELQNS